MTNEEKQLLLKDLCARLSYNVKVLVDYIDESNVNDTLNCLHIIGLKNYTGDDGLINIKPYLRPMSSMTEEERIEFSKLLDVRYCEEDWEGHQNTSYCIEIDNVYTDNQNGIQAPTPFSMKAIDWLNEYHFDYRGLIKKGLALEATEGMYN